MCNKNTNYFTSKFFYNNKISYGFFTRNGGKSKKPFNSLNCSFNNKDIKKNVIENINIAKEKLKLEKTQIKLLNQEHGNNIEIINKHNISKEIIADGSITQIKDISLAILTADCAPLFLINTDYKFICAVHLGWKGCLNNIIQNSLNKILHINKHTSKIVAIIGPCLGKQNFEVSKDFKGKFIEKNFFYKNYFLINNKNNKIYFDMRGLIEFQLKKASINNIFHINQNTYSEENLFFSHRRVTHKKGGSTGRMINIIGYRQ